MIDNELLSVFERGKFMWIKRICKTGLMLLLIMAVFTLFPSKTVTVKAKTVAEHEIFSNKEVKERIAEIKDYYYNKRDELARKNAVFHHWIFAGEKANFTYYLDDEELMFAYGKDKDTEYRLYFYNNQLIQLLIDKKGAKRKTYTQLYKKLDTSNYDDTLNLYMELEDFSIIRLDNIVSKTSKIVTGDRVFITGISNKSVTYHLGHGCGKDMSIRSLYPEVYTAAMTKNVKIKDYTQDPVKYKSRSVKWLKEKIGNYLDVCILVTKNGKLVAIEIPFES